MNVQMKKTSDKIPIIPRRNRLYIDINPIALDIPIPPPILPLLQLIILPHLDPAAVPANHAATLAHTLPLLPFPPLVPRHNTCQNKEGGIRGSDRGGE